MPICLDRDSSDGYDFGDARLTFRNASGDLGIDGPRVHIGLINNMPDGALAATERQFVKLLDSAADAALIRLSLYALPDVVRGEAGKHHVARHYKTIEDLWDSNLDGLIVTGTEPRTANLAAEPYWNSLTKVLDWAELNTKSTVWSCLAAHAAVLHMDGISRRRLPEKRCGVFECVRDLDHQLTAHTPTAARMPHSRWNEVPEHELKACGYRVLTHSKDAGPDMFVKKRKSLFVFFQGHPEYEANTLLLEYRRDVGRYLRGELASYPPMPQGYFDDQTALVFSRFCRRALSNRCEALLADFPMNQAETRLMRTWASTSAGIYRNWMLYLCAEKERRLSNAVPELSPRPEPLVQAAHL